MLQTLLSPGLQSRSTQVRVQQTLFQIHLFFRGLLWALSAILVVVFLFLVLYSAKSLLGYDFVPSVHFRDVIATFTM